MNPEQDSLGLSKWNQPFSSQNKCNFFQFEPTTYLNTAYGQLIICYDRINHISTSDIINQVKALHNLPQRLDVSLSLLIQGSENRWRLLGKYEQVYQWIDDREKTMNFRLTITKKAMIQQEEATVKLYGQDYFNNRHRKEGYICFVISHLNHKKVFLKYDESKSLENYVKEILPHQSQNIQNYQLFLLKFSRQPYQVGPSLKLHMFNIAQQAKYVEWASVIQIRRNGLERGPNNKHNLRIKGADVCLQINYEEYRQFRCENIFHMANLQLPETYALKYGNIIALSQDPLHKLNLESSLQNMQSSVIEVRILTSADIYLEQLRQIALSSEVSEEVLIQLGKFDLKNQDQEQKRKESKKKFNEIHSTTLQIEKSLQADLELPSIIKCHKCFRSLTAYTSNFYYKPINQNLRNRQYKDHLKPQNKVINTFTLYTSKNLQLLPYEKMNNNPSFRGVCIHYLVEQNDIIEAHEFLSSSKSREKGMSFVFGSQKPYSIISFIHYSGRLIEQFSVIDHASNSSNITPEREVLFAPYTKFIVRGKKTVGIQLQLSLQELPSVRNLAHKQIIWIGDYLDEGIQMVNNFRKRVHSIYSFLYMQTDILPFRNNQILQLWLEIHGQYHGERNKTVVVFTLPENIKEREWRVNFIHQHFDGCSYVCLGEYRPNTKLMSESSVSCLLPHIHYLEKVASIPQFIQEHLVCSFKNEGIESLPVSEIYTEGCCSNSTCQII